MTELTATAILNRIKEKALLTNMNIGVAAAGVTKQLEYGDGFNHTTILTIDADAALTLADNVAICDGKLIYTFPAGALMVNSAYINMLVTNAEHDAEAAELGVGTTIGTGAVATLATAGFENIITAYTNTVGTKSASIDGGNSAGGLGGLQIQAANPHIVHINIAATWANTAGAALDADLAGTVILNWSFFGSE